MARTAFVTGGTGFIGINLIALLVEEGWEVTALHRTSSNLEYLKRFPISLAEGSITDRESLERAIPEGTEVVFHVAGDTSFWRKNDARQDAVNIGGVRKMVEVSAAKGVKTFIHTSSNSVWGRAKGVITEETPSDGKSSWINYERSKHLGEIEAFKGIELGMKVVVLNPAEVLGPYDANTWGRMFFLLRDGALPAVGPSTVSPAHVYEVVRAHLAAVDKGGDGERYLLAGEDHALVDMAAEMAELIGAKVPRKAPPWVLKIYGRLSVMIAALSGKEPDVTPEIAEIATSTGVTFRSDKAMRELDYRIQPMSQCIRDTYDWLIKEGLLQTP